MWQCNSIFLNLINFCNVKCKKCITPKLVKKRGELNKDLLFFVLKKLQENKFYGIIRCGLGENLIYPYLENLLLNLSTNATNFKFDILTNGLAFDVEREIYYTNRSVRWGVTLDGMVQDDVRGLQYGIDVELVKKNLFSIRKKYPKCKIYLNYTLNKKNLRHLPDFVKMAIDLNVKNVYVTPLKVFKNHHTDFLKKYIPNLSEPNTASVFLEIKNMAKEKGLILKLPDNQCPTLPCSATGNYSPVIDIDGKVSFCSGQERVKIGNITHPNISLLWEKFKRKLEKKSAFSKFCLNCIMIKNQNKTILEMP